MSARNPFTAGKPAISAEELGYCMGLKRYGRSWRGDCPSCGYKGAFVANDGKRGGALLWCANGCGQRSLAATVNAISGGYWQPREQPDAATKEKERQRRQEAALRLWRGSVPITEGSAAYRYLVARGLVHLVTSSALLFRADVPHPEGGRLPALVALATNSADEPIGIHRTFLRADGSGKAAAEPQKASLGPVLGGAVRLDPAAPELVVGEGIETSASAGRLLNLPAWAAISAGNLAKGLMLPPAVRKVVIASDNDAPGREAACAAWFRWRGESREVRIATPDREGSDFNDVLKARLAREAI